MARRKDANLFSKFKIEFCAILTLLCSGSISIILKSFSSHKSLAEGVYCLARRKYCIRNGLLTTKLDPDKIWNLISSRRVHVPLSCLHKPVDFGLASWREGQKPGRDGAGRPGSNGCNVGHAVSGLDGQQVSGKLLDVNLLWDLKNKF